MSNAEVSSAAPAFSRGFKITLAFLSILCGLMLSLWASGHEQLWKWLPSAFCFAVAGTVVLPRSLALACGYFVSVTVCLLAGWFLYLGITDKEPLANALRFSAVFGLPAAAFLIFRQLPRAQ